MKDILLKYGVDDIIKAITKNDSKVIEHIIKNSNDYKELINYSDSTSKIGVISHLIIHNKLDYFKVLLPYVDFNKEDYRGYNVITEVLAKNRVNFIEAITEYIHKNAIPYDNWKGDLIDSQVHAWEVKSLYRLNSVLDILLCFDSVSSIKLIACIDQEMSRLELKECFRRLFLSKSGFLLSAKTVNESIKENWKNVNEIKCDFIKVIKLISDKDFDDLGYSYLVNNKDKDALLDKYLSLIEAASIAEGLPTSLPRLNKLKI